MYTVTTREEWKGHITEAAYDFDSIIHVLQFVWFCEEDNIEYKVKRNKHYNRKVS